MERGNTSEETDEEIVDDGGDGDSDSGAGGTSNDGGDEVASADWIDQDTLETTKAVLETGMAAGFGPAGIVASEVAEALGEALGEQIRNLGDD